MKRRHHKQKVVEMLKRGACPRDIMAAIPGACPFLISRYRKELGIKPFKPGRTPGKTERFISLQNQIRQMKISGMTYRQIGGRLHLSRQRVQQYLRIKRPIGRNRCDKCKVRTKVLSCHHVSYKDDSKYEVLCQSCHMSQHGAPKGRQARFLERQPRIITMIKSGMSCREIAKLEGITPEAVRYYLK